MDISVVTSKGQLVIPASLRRKLGIQKGTRVTILERNGELLIKPLSEDYFKQFMGLLPGKGKSVRALIRERKKDREKENNNPG